MRGLSIRFMRIFLAGASGAIGRRLVPLLLGAGHQVTGTTRYAETARMLERAGVMPAVVDVFDASALTAAVLAAQPAVIIHQLTDLPREFDEARARGVRPEECAHPQRRDAQPDRGGASGRDASFYRPKHFVCLCAWRRAPPRDRSAQPRRSGPGGHGEGRGGHGASSPGGVWDRRDRAAVWPAVRTGHLVPDARLASPPCTSMRRRTQLCWLSRAAGRASTTSQTTMGWFRSPRRAPNWVLSP